MVIDPQTYFKVAHEDQFKRNLNKYFKERTPAPPSSTANTVVQNTIKKSSKNIIKGGVGFVLSGLLTAGGVTIGHELNKEETQNKRIQLKHTEITNELTEVKQQ